jgi:hypothetical protein
MHAAADNTSKKKMLTKNSHTAQKTRGTMCIVQMALPLLWAYLPLPLHVQYWSREWRT